MTAIFRRLCHNLRHFSSSTKYSWFVPTFIEPEDTYPLIKPRWCKPSPAVKKRNNSPYKLPSSLDRTGQKPYSSDLHFDFQFSYTETPRANPIGFREARFSPFGPGKIDRQWTGWCAPHASSEVTSIDAEDDNQDPSLNVRKYGGRFREDILGEPLSKQEIQALIDQCRHQNTKRQVNLGRDGLTHNMINDIHNNWRYAPAVRIKCLGVPTVDMKNVFFQLERKKLQTQRKAGYSSNALETAHTRISKAHQDDRSWVQKKKFFFPAVRLLCLAWYGFSFKFFPFLNASPPL